MSVHTLLRTLGYRCPTSTVVPQATSFHHPDVVIEAAADQGRFVVRHSANEWHVHSKVVLEAEQLHAVACITMRFAPVGSTVSLQADTHSAGTVFVGMIMTFANQSIPIHLVSGDIRCGLTVLPLAVLEEGNVRHLQLSKTAVVKQCAEYIRSAWGDGLDSLRCLVFDLSVTRGRGGLTADEVSRMRAKQDACLAAYVASVAH